jgi:anti-sigma factor RsiW
MLDKHFPDRVPMDCRTFRKMHLAYLDDTLSGDDMADASRHIMACDGCAAHDTLVRRSLMIVQTMPTIAPSAEFQQKLRARLAECREQAMQSAKQSAMQSTMPQRRSVLPAPLRSPRTLAALAASAMIGTMLWRGLTPNVTPMVSMQPVIASQPAELSIQPYVSPDLIRAMSTGNPVWPAAMIIEDAPTQFVSSDFRLISETQSR